jgi:DNA-binding NtrC family response regulator
VGMRLDEAEREIIRSTLAAHNGNKTRTAEVLGIGRKTLHRKITEYGLD